MKPVIIDSVLANLRDALAKDEWERAVMLVQSLRPADQADVFVELPPDEQDELLPRLDVEDSADILEELEDEEAAEVASRQDASDLARILAEMEPDEAADLLGDIEPQRAKEALAALPAAGDVLPLLSYPDDSAGGKMTGLELKLRSDLTVEETIAYLRARAPDEQTSSYLFVTDCGQRLVGVVSLRTLIVASPAARIADIMDSDAIYVQAEADQEKAARLMVRYDLAVLPVVDVEMRLLGVITHDDLFDVIEDEATEDIYRLGGVPEEHPADVSLPTALRGRLPWLILNLGTAMASAAVLSMFESTIARLAVLAAFFPMVAGVSGSAATQALTVTVRGLALGEIAPARGLRTLRRELLIGLANGVVIGGLVALIALLWKGALMLGGVVGAATLLNMICAATAGVLVPLGMQAVKIDPALASPILVTTTTDTFGYLAYLGLATALLAMLL